MAFCQEIPITLLSENEPMPGETLDPFYNKVPEDENDVVEKRVADVVLTPLIVRAKREAMLESREKINSALVVRAKRQASGYQPGRFRGQTQSQYLNVGAGGQKEGKAEAEATDHSSRAVVSEY